MTKITWVLGLLLSYPAAGVAQARVDVLDPEILKQLDRPGHFSLATVLGQAETEKARLETKGDKLGYLKLLRNADLYAASPSRYAEIARVIRADIEEVIAKSGEKFVAYSSETAEKVNHGNVPRHLDYYWLNSAEAAFPLIAVVNRVDKKDFYAGTCGEARFIYRLAYARGNTRSTLPMFLNVVFDYPMDNTGRCQETARLWTDPSVLPSDEKDARLMAADLERLPLDRARLRFKQVEVNMQILRYPSELKFDFGGQAAYLFRIFQEKEGRLQPIPLENTLDVSAVAASPELKAKLIAQLKDPRHLEAIDNGTFVLENSDGRLLSTRALSFTTSGRARLANKPFTAALGAAPAELADVNYGILKLVKSSRGLVERLNNTSCMGCHQGGGTAGFHMLGRGGELSTGFNLVILPFSPHYGAERARRREATRTLADGGEASTFRPLSFFAGAVGRVRDLCLPEKQTDFAMSATCAPGNSCRVTAKNAALGVNVGECVADNPVPGHVCREGLVASQPMALKLGDLFGLSSLRDTIQQKQFTKGRCTTPDQGVPLGRIPERCLADSPEGRLEFVDKMKDASGKPPKLCAVQGGDQFDDCSKMPDPPACLDKAEIKRAFLDTCSDAHFCREDYICQQLPLGVAGQYKGKVKEQVAARLAKLVRMHVGFCVPNYFVFNMRADGHVVPETRPR